MTDVLSRKYEPTRKGWKLPLELIGVEEAFPAERTSDWHLVAHNPREQEGSERL